MAPIQRYDDTVDDLTRPAIVRAMKGKLTAIIETAPGGGYWAICPEVPGANGQGETVAAAKKISEMPSVSFSRTGSKMRAGASPQKRYKPSSPSDEAPRLGEAAPPRGMLSQARRRLALAVDQPSHRRG